MNKQVFSSVGYPAPESRKTTQQRQTVVNSNLFFSSISLAFTDSF